MKYFYAESNGEIDAGVQYGTQHLCELHRFQSKRARDEYINDVNTTQNSYSCRAITLKEAERVHKDQIRFWRKS